MSDLVFTSCFMHTLRRGVTMCESRYLLAGLLMTVCMRVHPYTHV